MITSLIVDFFASLASNIAKRWLAMRESFLRGKAESKAEALEKQNEQRRKADATRAGARKRNAAGGLRNDDGHRRDD